MATYTTNERIVIDRLKENKDFDYLMNIDFDNITIGNGSRADKGLSKGYRMNPDFTIHFLLNLISSCCYIGPIASEEVLIAPHHIDNAERAVINNYFLIVCLDKLITKYKSHPVAGFMTKDTWQESWSDIEHTVFFMDSLSKSLRVEVSIITQDAAMGLPYRAFRSEAAIEVKVRNSLTGKVLSFVTCTFSKVAEMIEHMIEENK